jgi:hypothetical protein
VITLSGFQALAVLAIVFLVFWRFCTVDETSPAPRSGSKGEARRASLTGGPGARRPRGGAR